jgi:hypothetical protein
MDKKCFVSNCEVMENLCIQICNQHIRNNLVSLHVTLNKLEECHLLGYNAM